LEYWDTEKRWPIDHAPLSFKKILCRRKDNLHEQFGAKSGVEFVESVQEELLASHHFFMPGQRRGVKGA
jgi:hypothetical protein